MNIILYKKLNTVAIPQYKNGIIDYSKYIYKIDDFEEIFKKTININNEDYKILAEDIIQSISDVLDVDTKSSDFYNQTEKLYLQIGEDHKPDYYFNAIFNSSDLIIQGSFEDRIKAILAQFLKDKLTNQS